MFVCSLSVFYKSAISEDTLTDVYIILPFVTKSKKQNIIFICFIVLEHSYNTFQLSHMKKEGRKLAAQVDIKSWMLMRRFQVLNLSFWGPPGKRPGAINLL